MLNRDTLRRHAGLVDQMATTLGLDLEEKVMMGQLRVATLGDAVLACTGCSDADGCEHWLAMQNNQADTPPGLCRNAELFSMLKDGRAV